MATFLVSQLSRRGVHSTCCLNQVQMMARLRVVDNSALGKQAMLEGKPPKVINVYQKGVKRRWGHLGDKVLLAIKGHMKKGILIGTRQRQNAMVPRFDSNNVVLIEDNGNPLGTRILAPVPHVLRKKPELAKLIAISTKFV